MKRNITILSGLMALVLSAQALAVGPSPALEAKIASGEVLPPPYLHNLQQNYAKGVCIADEHSAIVSIIQDAMYKSTAEGAPVATTFKALAILVDFSDHVSSVNAQFFDSLLFAVSGNSVRNYYSEISYAQLDLVTVDMPSSIGWERAPQTYAYYVNGANGTGSYPNNTQKLVEDVVDQVNASVDFSQYDNDNNGTVDCLVIIHSGSGAEFTGSPNDIWSHKWAISPRVKDGVVISSFTVQPEFWVSPGDMTIGVYAHELGHGFGLPDLYDTDYSSWGIGRWSLMASGSWNGPGNLGSSPAHPDAWSRIEMGLATATNVTGNSTSNSIPSVESGNNIFRLWTAGALGNEYFLVENRQKTGYDTYIPGSGLMIWHIDESRSNNTKEWYPTHTSSGNYLVALEQADGLYNLEKKVDLGSAGDAFSTNTGNTSFSPSSTPSSNSYANVTTFVGVTNISASGAVMTADFTVSLSAGTEDENDGAALPSELVVHQNYPNPFNPTTSISFDIPKSGNVTVTVFNILGQAVDVIVDGILGAGTHEVQWDGKSYEGNEVGSGIYFYEVETEDASITKKMTFVK